MTDIAKVCQKCCKEQATTRSRSVRMPEFMGPCGDSFCYASCDMSTCRPVQLVICDDCEDDIAVEAARALRNKIVVEAKKLIKEKGRKT